MRAALIVARELLQCRLAESGCDALLKHVAELLDAATRGTPPFRSLPTPQVVARSHIGPRRARMLPGAPGGFIGIGAGAYTDVAPRDPSGISPYHHLGGALGPAAWSTGRLSGGSGAAALEAYVPRMVDQEYTPEDDPDSFLEPGWEEEMLEVEAFQEPPRSLADPALLGAGLS